MLFRSRIAAVVLIAVGGLLLVSNLGLVPQLGPLLHQWWPLLLVLVGVWILVQRQRRWW